MSEYMVKLFLKHTNQSGIRGDFHHLDLSARLKMFNLQNIVTCPTRKNTYLDKIFTNVARKLQSTLLKLAALGRSDHDSVFVPHVQCIVAKRNTKLI